MPTPLAMEVFRVCGALLPGVVHHLGFQCFTFVQELVRQQAVDLHSLI